MEIMTAQESENFIPRPKALERGRISEGEKRRKGLLNSETWPWTKE